MRQSHFFARLVAAERLADRTTHRTTPVPNPHQSMLRRMCHFDSAGLPPQCLVELQFRDWLSAQVRMRASTDHALLRPPGLLSGQTPAGCFYASSNSGMPGAEMAISYAARSTVVKLAR